MRDGYGIKILKSLTQDEDYRVREDVVKAAGRIGEEEGLEIINLVIQDEENEASFSLRRFLRDLFP